MSKLGALSASIAIMRQKYQAPGSAYGPGLAIAHAMRCLQRTHYTDRPEMRLRRHVIIYGPRGTVKSSSTKFFLTQLAGGIDAMDATEFNRPRMQRRPAIAFVAGGTSWERLRGTVGQDGSIMSPVLQRADWIYVPELLSFLGHNPQKRAERVEDLNGVQEEGHVRVTLVKMGNMELDKRIEMANSIPDDAGYTYDPNECVLSYECRSSFVGCSRIISPKALEELVDSGYWSRHSVEEWVAPESHIRSYADRKFGHDPPAVQIEYARAKFLDLWNTEFRTANAPPPSMITDCVRWYNEQLDEVARECEKKFSELFSARDDTDIAQLLTAASLDRLSSSRAIGDVSPVDAIDYSDADVRTAKLWMVARIAHLRNSFDKALDEKKSKDADRAFDELHDFIVKCREEARDSAIHIFTSEEFVNFYLKKNKGSGASTARLYIRRLKLANMVSPVRESPGQYHIDDEALRRMGYSPDENRQESTLEEPMEIEE